MTDQLNSSQSAGRIPAECLTLSAATSSAIPTAGAAMSLHMAQFAYGVHVMRVIRRDDGTITHCSALFGDMGNLKAWLEADSMRFAHPLVFQQARRTLAQFIGGGNGHDQAAR